MDMTKPNGKPICWIDTVKSSTVLCPPAWNHVRTPRGWGGVHYPPPPITENNPIVVGVISLTSRLQRQRSKQSGRRIDELSSVSCSACRIEQLLLSTMEFHPTNHCCRNKYSNRRLLLEFLRWKFQNFQAFSCCLMVLLGGQALFSQVPRQSTPYLKNCIPF